MHRLSSTVVALSLVLFGRGVAAESAQPAEPDVPGEPAPAPGLDDADEPSLPAGLDDADEPSLPAGLDDTGEPPVPDGLGGGDGEPELPAGLGGESGAADAAGASVAEPGIPAEWHMSADLRGGVRLRSDPYEDRAALGELRLQLDVSKSWRRWASTARLVADGIADPLADEQLPKLESGTGALDIRIASLSMTPSESVDLRLGRQVLTWGTGDLLFINDLFPKDWTAFLIGRADEYLKAPSDAAKISLYSAEVEADIVLMPRFDADRLPLRDRLSSWDPALGRVAGQDAPLVVEQPERWGRDGEVAARLHRTLEGWEVAAYGYYGFWKSPAGANPDTGAGIHPALSVYGASVRGPVLRGIANAELGWYDSRDDRSGEDPFIRNSEGRVLVGYERQLMRNVTGAVQYYLEAMHHHGRYVRGLPPGAPAADERRHVTTARITWMGLRQQLRFTVFAAASPSDRDAYVRPTATYAVSDRWAVFGGGNVFLGKREHTFFGQLERNTNAYLGLRYAR